MVFSKQGNGTKVLNSSFWDKEDAKFRLNNNNGLSKDLKERAVSLSSEVIEFEVEFPKKEVSERLQLDATAPVYRIVRLRLLDNQPYVIEHTYMPVDLVPGLDESILKEKRKTMSEPLFLKSLMHDKIWGGTKLREVFGYDIPTETTGEYWAISAHPNGVSVVANGQFEGRQLDELYRNEPTLFGHPKEKVFPLLTKILDANDWLSVQVHPDDAYGLEHEGELGKTECWYVIAADEGAEIIYGHNAKSKAELRQMIEEKDWEHLLTRIPVKAGDFFYVPSGTMHAIGKGILILETQQSSDTTYRVYDFDRKDAQGNLRELHIEKSIDVLNIGEPENSVPATLELHHLRTTCLVSNQFFTVYKWEVEGLVQMRRVAPYLLLSVIDGQGSLLVDNKLYNLQKGSHLILPHTISEWEFDGNLEMIVSHPNNVR